MAIIQMTPGATTTVLEAHTDLRLIVPDIKLVPGGLYPLHSAVYEMDEYRIMSGWPVSVPDYDIHANTMVSVDGEILSDRLDPASITTDALLRWTAGETYDPDKNVWEPIQGPNGYVWQTAPDFAPVLAYDYEYRIKDERFLMETLNFDSDTYNHMWLSLESLLTGAAGYTVIMVMSPNSIFGNDTDVPYNGLWCPGRATPVGLDFTENIDPHWNAVTIQGNYLYLDSDEAPRSITVPLANQLSDTAPCYVAMSFSRPYVSVYVASGT